MLNVETLGDKKLYLPVKIVYNKGFFEYYK